MRIPGFGTLDWNPRGKEPCFSCGNQTSLLYRNPNGQMTPCCADCYNRIYAYVGRQRIRNTIKNYVLWFLLIVAMAVAAFLGFLYVVKPMLSE